MTERKPITADLRRWWELHCRALATPELDEGLDALCGAIDAVHANLEGESESLRRELDRALGEWDYWESTHVELPKDADGVHICAGDKLDGYGKTIEVVELRYGRSGWVLVSRDGNGYADTFAFSHHAQTVEDVLREMADRIYADEDEPRSRDAIVAEFAAKLRLADDEGVR